MKIAVEASITSNTITTSLKAKNLVIRIIILVRNFNNPYAEKDDRRLVELCEIDVKCDYVWLGEGMKE
ncbi:MAG TPA: hypothetical protein VLX91_04380 [Candidatus Acidoferrales bacterium]|nr:hypothetical protein [Candidatus Acidoferrales bacterium]